MGEGVRGRRTCCMNWKQKSVWYVDQCVLLFWEREESREKWMRILTSCTGVKQIDESYGFWTTVLKVSVWDGADGSERNQKTIRRESTETWRLGSHPARFHILAIMNSTDRGLQVSFLCADFIFFKLMPRSGVLLLFFIYVESRGKKWPESRGGKGKRETVWNRILGCDA